MSSEQIVLLDRKIGLHTEFSFSTLYVNVESQPSLRFPSFYTPPPNSRDTHNETSTPSLNRVRSRFAFLRRRRRRRSLTLLLLMFTASTIVGGHRLGFRRRGGVEVGRKRRKEGAGGCRGRESMAGASVFACWNSSHLARSLFLLGYRFGGKRCDGDGLEEIDGGEFENHARVE